MLLIANMPVNPELSFMKMLGEILKPGISNTLLVTCLLFLPVISTYTQDISGIRIVKETDTVRPLQRVMIVTTKPGTLAVRDAKNFEFFRKPADSRELPRTSAQGKKVSVKMEDGSWQLIVNDKPFFIKGVVGSSYLEKVKEYGGNSIRTGWRKEQLDKASQLGLNALVNLPAGAERDGMNYNDTAAVRKQTERIVSVVKETKDHPAILMWAIGNELDYIPPLEPFNPKLWDAVNNAARAIHKADPDHPVMTVIGTSLMHKVADIVKQCPDLDLLGVNTYGDIYTLQDTLRKYGWTKPYVITEWGPDGYWEVRKTPWRAPYEQTGLEKFQCYENKYLKGIKAAGDQCLGSYVFYWAGFKQETTHTWFCMFDENGLESPLPGLMKLLWTGDNNFNRAPVADSMKIDGRHRYDATVLHTGTTHTAEIFARDPDGDIPTYRWEIRPEAVYASYAGQGEKVPEPIPGLAVGESARISFTAPSKPGPYRLFGYTYDNKGHFSTVNLPFLAAPVLSDTLTLGKYTSRTINLLKTSTPEDPKKVKILVYGQSISEQAWWLRVKKHVEEKYPDADIIMENKSIGGFAAQLLYKTVEMDVSSFYPDLVLLHIYGDNRYYDSVLYTIRSRTATEVAIMTDHFTGEHKWSDTMSYHILPALAEKYKCDIINIRDGWKEYLNLNNLKPSALLKDGVHLNDYGNIIMSELVKPLFNYRPQYIPDPFKLSTTVSGEQLKFKGNKLVIDLEGNRALAVFDGNSKRNGDSIKVMVDNRSPYSFPGSWYLTRPYDEKGRKWPWELPAMIRIRNSVPWIEEEWSCTFGTLEKPYSDFSFSIRGSVTGNDGEGSSARDFSSVSGRIIIKSGDAESGGDWHLMRSYRVTKAALISGETVKWKAYPIGKEYLSATSAEKDFPYDQIVFQGIPNEKHQLVLERSGKNTARLKEVIIYKPYFKGIIK